MATEKQAKLMTRLAVRAGKITPAKAAAAEAKYLTYSAEDTRALINGLNDLLGFHRGLSPATTRQRAFILDLEERVLGRWETTHQTPLSYDDADTRIQYLNRLLDAQKAEKPVSGEVIDLFTRKAV